LPSEDDGLEKAETFQTVAPKTSSCVAVEAIAVVGKTETTRNLTPKTPKTTSSYKDEASKLGLVATWSIEFGYISIHDPITGEWHDILTAEAPAWAKSEAFKRKEIYKDGNRKAYRLTSREMEDIWEAEHVSEPEGIVEDYPIEEE
jgi:hypothetical protein